MTVITKLALTQINTRLASENDALRGQVSQLQADLLRVTEVASAVNVMQRPAGHWVGVEEYDDDYGQPRARTFGRFATRAEAEADSRSDLGVSFVADVKPVRGAYEMPQWQKDRAATMAAAKALALASRSTVKA